MGYLVSRLCYQGRSSPSMNVTRALRSHLIVMLGGGIHATTEMVQVASLTCDTFPRARGMVARLRLCSLQYRPSVPRSAERKGGVQGTL